MWTFSPLMACSRRSCGRGKPNIRNRSIVFVCRDKFSRSPSRDPVFRFRLAAIKNYVKWDVSNTVFFLMCDWKWVNGAVCSRTRRRATANNETITICDTNNISYFSWKPCYFVHYFTFCKWRILFTRYYKYCLFQINVVWRSNYRKTVTRNLFCIGRCKRSHQRHRLPP